MVRMHGERFLKPKNSLLASLNKDSGDLIYKVNLVDDWSGEVVTKVRSIPELHVPLDRVKLEKPAQNFEVS